MRDVKELLSRNLARWKLSSPVEAALLVKYPEPALALCTTKADELNLKAEREGKVIYYHAENGAVEEANQWFSTLDLYNINSLFVYGVGLGYYYEAAREWLRANPNRRLIFLEDNLEVIYRLFETDLGSKLLEDQRVLLQYFHHAEKDGEGLKKGLQALALHLFVGDIRFSALHRYSSDYPERFVELTSQLEYLKNIKTYQLMEHMAYGSGFFRNYYRNLLELPQAYLGDRLFGRFTGIPAIICGAGPSLEKNLPLLEKLANNALIFSGGSATNAINVRGFLPHFGINIDPNLGQYLRHLMNQAYEVPFFYRNRMFPEGLRLIHGPHLFVTGSGGYDIARWFEKRLGIEEKIEIPEGYNVLNFGLSLAHALGCNPIIFIGIDLAYTDGRSYASGVLPHPLYDVKGDIQTKSSEDHVIQKFDIYGQPLNTLWKWLSESLWYTHFAVTHPTTTLINATEGGIGFEGIINIPLQKVAELYLNKQFDFATFVHGEIQNSPLPPTVTIESVLEAMEELLASLNKCKECCHQLRREFHHLWKQIREENKAPEHLITDRALELLKELHQEPAYHAIMHIFSETFLTFYGVRELEKHDVVATEKEHSVEIALKRTFLNKRRYEFLKAVANTNINHLKKNLEEHRIRMMVNKALSSKGQQHAEGESHLPDKKENYLLEGTQMTILDEEMGLSLKENICISPLTQEPNIAEGGDVLPKVTGEWNGAYCLSYPNGSIKMEQFYRQGKLCGPSTYYGQNGELLARSWYIDGVRQGKSRSYYSSGKLYSLERYRDGIRDGRQEFYYPNGHPKASLDYKMGKLNGKVVLYYSNGVRQRQLQFLDGERNGKEFLWNMGGILEMEIEYHADRPVGTGRVWYTNGQVAREAVYDEEGRPSSIRGWSPEGVLLPSDSLSKEDYFDQVAKQTKALTDSLEEVFTQVKKIAPHIQTILQKKQGSEAFDIGANLAELKKEMENLRKIQKEMEEEPTREAEDAKEVLWKTPETRRLLGKKLDEAVQEMSQYITSAEEALRLTSEMLGSGQKKDQDEQDSSKNTDK